MQSSPNQGLSVNVAAASSSMRENIGAIPLRMKISKVNFYYGPKQILFDISMGIADKRVTALIGPSGCGKSTLLRTLNRMHETVSTSRLEGEILLDQQNILAQDVTLLRRRVGMVFQRPNPFPKSIFDNVAYGPRINGMKGPVAEIVEKQLRINAKKACIDALSGCLASVRAGRSRDYQGSKLIKRSGEHEGIRPDSRHKSGRVVAEKMLKNIEKRRRLK